MPHAESNKKILGFILAVLLPAALTGAANAAAAPEDFEISNPYVIQATPAIEYPAWARRHGWEGEALVRVEVTPAGRVGRLRIEKSTGYKILDRAALRSMRSWKFRPAADGSASAASSVVIPVEFHLSKA